MNGGPSLVLKLMPYVTHRGARIYWEEHGAGDPILLVMGLSFTLEMWYRIVPFLSAEHRVILLDNRGVGRSNVPRGPYSIGLMAEDAMAVLDAASVTEPACLIGVSMGGMIAQEMALRYPERFGAMMLVSTSCGALYRGRWPNFRRVPRFRRWLETGGEARDRTFIRFFYADETPRERIEEDIRARANFHPTLRGVLSQLCGILCWSSYGRLPRLRLPVWVIHGDQDHVLPPENGRIVARRISGAEFVLVPQAGHILATDQPELTLEILGRFLARVKGMQPAEPRL
jgi:pimeloyl-ACP methyl ester carboxylesterase